MQEQQSPMFDSFVFPILHKHLLGPMEEVVNTWFGSIDTKQLPQDLANVSVQKSMCGTYIQHFETISMQSAYWSSSTYGCFA